VTTETISSTSSVELKNALNVCLTVLAEGTISNPVPSTTTTTTPIYQRRGAAPPNRQTLEKQALSEAAQALSQLWNVRRGRK